MTNEALKSFASHILIPFMMGAVIGLLLMSALYFLDVGGFRSLLARTGESPFDVGLIPVAFAFGSLAIGTRELLIDN